MNKHSTEENYEDNVEEFISQITKRQTFNKRFGETKAHFND